MGDSRIFLCKVRLHTKLSRGEVKMTQRDSYVNFLHIQLLMACKAAAAFGVKVSGIAQTDVITRAAAPPKSGIKAIGNRLSAIIIS